MISEKKSVSFQCPRCGETIDIEMNIKSRTQPKVTVREENVLNYSQLHKYFPTYMSTSKAIKVLRGKGITIGQKGLFAYLRQNEYLSTDDMSYNYPTHKASSKGWIVAVWSSRSTDPETKRFFTPHLSPGFIELIEKDLKETLGI